MHNFKSNTQRKHNRSLFNNSNSLFFLLFFSIYLTLVAVFFCSASLAEKHRQQWLQHFNNRKKSSIEMRMWLISARTSASYTRTNNELSKLQSIEKRGQKCHRISLIPYFFHYHSQIIERRVWVMDILIYRRVK